MDEVEARRRFASAPVARLATADERGRPHLVPIMFAVDTAAAGRVGRDTIYSAVDHKPKRTTALRRLVNVSVNPAVALLVDRYDEDWTTLWWVRANGTGRVVDPAADEARHARVLLAGRYRQYQDEPPAGPVLAVDVTGWTGWSASGA